MIQNHRTDLNDDQKRIKALLIQNELGHFQIK